MKVNKMHWLFEEQFILNPFNYNNGSFGSKVLVNLDNCTGAGACFQEFHWDSASSTIFAVRRQGGPLFPCKHTCLPMPALFLLFTFLFLSSRLLSSRSIQISLGFNGKNVVSQLFPTTGKSIMTGGEFGDLCGLLEGGTAYAQDTKTFYAILSCAGTPSAFEVQAFDLANGGKSSVVLAMGQDDGPRRLAWSKTTGLIGLTDSSVVRIADNKTVVIATPKTGKTGNPSTHTLAIKEAPTPTLFYVDTLANNSLVAVDLRTGKFDTISMLNNYLTEMVLM